MDELAARASDIRFSDVKPADQGQLRLLLLDASAVAFAGARAAPGREPLWRYARRARSPGSCTVIGASWTSDPELAAFVNGGFVHALNYDANCSDGGHVGASSVMAPLAIAEDLDADMGTLFSGVAAGTLVTSHIARQVASSAETGWLNGQVQGTFGAAAAAGRALGLSAEHLSSALGLALMQAAGTKQIMETGAKPAKSYYGAFANRCGVLSARLAADGMDGSVDWLHGTHGLLQRFYRMPAPSDLAVAGPQFSTDFEFKFTPASTHVEPFLWAASRLRDQVDHAVDDIVEVAIVAPEKLGTWLVGLEECVAVGASSACDSIPYAVACGLLWGGLGVGDVDVGRLMEAEELLGMRITSSTSSVSGFQGSIAVHFGHGSPASIDLAEADQRRAPRTSGDDVRAKAIECLTGADGLSRREAEQFADSVLTASEHQDVRTVMRPLAR